jgi:hypothetical protein
MRRLFILLLFFASYIDLSAQVLKGTIKDSSGEPLAYATVYIRELQQGTTSNTKGNYEIRLPEGKYTVIYQNLGFAPDIRDITIGKTTVVRDIILQIQYYEIPEVRITSTGEDPAYGIMRRVIGLAPYYLNQVSHYKAEVYLKGNLVINRIPKIMQKAMRVEARNDAGNSVNSTQMKAGDSFLMESVNELEFNAPDKFTQRVLSYQSTFPDEGNEISPVDFIEASFYQPVLADMAISPLSPEAFSHYNFKYMGASPQGNFIVDKIQVIPKRKSQQLFSGTIFIIEDLWCLHSVDLNNENIAGKIKVQQVYIPVKEDIWLPVSHKFEINIGIIGFKADAGYGSSIKYLEVAPNTNLKKPEMKYLESRNNLIAEKRAEDTVVTKTRKQIDKILSKDELSNRDMVKLSGLMEKESKESLSDSVKNNLEIKDNVNHIVEKDAAKKDSTYWAEIRPIPLSEADRRSLRVADSIKAKLAVNSLKNDTITGKKEEKSKFFRTLKEIASGHTYSDTLGFRFTNEGLLKLKKLNFNPVDGFVYGADFRFTKTWRKSGNSFSFNPSFNWAFSRNQPMWSINVQYRFDRRVQRQIYLVTGATSKDFNFNGGITPFLNTATSLLMKKNWLKLYESRYITIGYKTEISNGFNLNIFSTLEDRSLLSNTTDFSLIRSSRQYTENVPENPFLKNPVIGSNPLTSHRHGDITASVSYTPRQKYRLFGERKIPMGSDWPTFSLAWKHGMNEIPGTGPTWKHNDMLRFEATKSSETGAFGEYYWTIRAGGFLNNKDIPFYDFFHFNSQPLFLSLKSHTNAFMLPGFYSLSTPEYFFEAHGKYTTPYLLLKLLPVLSNTLMRENVSLSVLYTHYQKCYTEIGYSVSEVLLLGEVGVYAGFDNLRYKSFGAKVVLKFN